MTRLRGGGEVQEGEGRDQVRICGRGPETNLLTVRTGARLIYRLSGEQKHKKGGERGGGDEDRDKRWGWGGVKKREMR